MLLFVHSLELSEVVYYRSLGFSVRYTRVSDSGSVLLTTRTLFKVYW